MPVPVTLPLPDTFTVSVGSAKFAVTECASPMSSLQLTFVPAEAQSPPQPRNTKPVFADAVRVGVGWEVPADLNV